MGKGAGAGARRGTLTGRIGRAIRAGRADAVAEAVFVALGSYLAYKAVKGLGRQALRGALEPLGELPMSASLDEVVAAMDRAPAGWKHLSVSKPSIATAELVKGPLALPAPRIDLARTALARELVKRGETLPVQASFSQRQRSIIFRGFEAARDKAEQIRRNVTEFSYGGVKKSVYAWAKQRGMSYGTLRNRIKKGWSFAEALNTPTRTQKAAAKRRERYIAAQSAKRLARREAIIRTRRGQRKRRGEE